MRVHGTTGQQPKDHYDRLERSKMTQYFPNDALLLEKTDMSTRKADKTGLISWKASKYSVPMKWQKARVRVQEIRSEEHTSELQSRGQLVCRLLLENKNRPSASWWIELRCCVTL